MSEQSSIIEFYEERRGYAARDLYQGAQDLQFASDLCSGIRSAIGIGAESAVKVIFGQEESLVNPDNGFVKLLAAGVSYLEFATMLHAGVFGVGAEVLTYAANFFASPEVEVEVVDADSIELFDEEELIG